MTIDNSALPPFLQTYSDLSDYIRDTLDDLDNTEKGRSFARFISRMIPLSELGEQFVSVELGQDSKDGGVDLISNSIDETRCYRGCINKTTHLDACANLRTINRIEAR